MNSTKTACRPLPISTTCSSGYGNRGYRSKSEWAGISLSDAFKHNLDYFIRLPAQNLFYRRAKAIQFAAASHAGAEMILGYVPDVKPQLGPCYTSYPGGQAAYAALGLTAYLEFQSQASEKILVIPLEEYLNNPAAADDVRVDSRSYRRLAEMVTMTVQRRLLVMDLAGHPELGCIEMYRLFLASQLDTRLHTLKGMLNATILLGDLLPPWSDFELHPLTRTILEKITEINQPYIAEPPSADPDELIQYGEAWVRSTCMSLVDHLPAPEGSDPADRDPSLLLRPFADRHPDATKIHRHASDKKPIPPLDAPRHPFFLDPSDATKALAALIYQSLKRQDKKFHALMSYLDEKTPYKSLMSTLARFSEVVSQSARQANEREDMRSDLLEEALRGAIFEEGPIKGAPADGHVVQVPINEQEGYEGEIFDMPVILESDRGEHEDLLERSRELTEIMRSTLYPNTGTVHVSESLKTSGTLDTTRLPLAGTSDTIFKRYRFVKKADRRGRPTLVIACDGSGSLNIPQMEMLKLLTTAWLESTVKTDIQVLAGLYHSGEVRPGLTGPLVRWIWHPRKTPHVTRADASKCVAALPFTGTGVQSDALSLAFIMDQARQLSAGSMVYLIHITDCCWNRSFESRLPGKEEMRRFYTSLLSEYGNRLHVTMVGLGVEEETGFENLLHKVITFSGHELGEPEKVARSIGQYTASIVRERKRKNGQHH